MLKPFDKKRVAQAIQKARAKQEAGALPAEKIETLVRMIESQKQPAAKILLKTVGRMFLVDQRDICYAWIEDGVITVVTGGPVGMEGQSNCRTLEELLDSLDTKLFWRAHRSYLVNINRIREVVPWFKSSYQLRMDDKKQTEIPVSRAQTQATAGTIRALNLLSCCGSYWQSASRLAVQGWSACAPFSAAPVAFSAAVSTAFSRSLIRFPLCIHRAPLE